MMLNDTAGNEAFDRYGFLKLPAFLSSEKVEQLYTLYNEVQPGQVGDRMYSNIHSFSSGQNQDIGKRILEICEADIRRVFADYQIVGASFIIKGSGNHSESSLHQDWSIVDESKHKSLILWIPLVDVDQSNGCIQVIPGSHSWFRTIRSSNISSLYLEFNSKLDPYLLSVPLKKKDALIFSMQVFHGSKINTSGQDRPVAVVTLIDNSARYIHYLKKPDNSIDVLESDTRYAFHNFFGADKKPESGEIRVVGRLKDVTDYQVTKKSFFRKLHSERGGWLSRLLHSRLA